MQSTAMISLVFATHTNSAIRSHTTIVVLYVLDACSQHLPILHVVSKIFRQRKREATLARGRSPIICLHATPPRAFRGRMRAPTTPTLPPEVALFAREGESAWSRR